MGSSSLKSILNHSKATAKWKMFFNVSNSKKLSLLHCHCKRLLSQLSRLIALEAQDQGIISRSNKCVLFRSFVHVYFSKISIQRLLVVKSFFLSDWSLHYYIGIAYIVFTSSKQHIPWCLLQITRVKRKNSPLILITTVRKFTFFLGKFSINKTILQ